MIEMATNEGAVMKMKRMPKTQAMAAEVAATLTTANGDGR